MIGSYSLVELFCVCVQIMFLCKSRLVNLMELLQQLIHFLSNFKKTEMALVSL